MKQAALQIDSSQLRQFDSLGKLNNEEAQELLRTSITTEVSAGMPVFQQGDDNSQVYYLISGKVEITINGKKQVIKDNTREARKPLGLNQPGQTSAIALTDSTLLCFDADLLDLFLNWTNPNAYVVNEMSTSKDHEWMNRLLQSRGLLRFSEEQISNLLNRMSEVHVKAGDIVVSQDNDNNEYYYVIKKGKAVVSRKPDASTREVKLAELVEGDAFGEESILTTSRRGATVTMQEDGDLMRLSRKDFSELLANPLLNTVSWDEAQALVAEGAAMVDIRQPDEYEVQHVPESINLALPVLRLKLKQLSHHRKYIVYCDDGCRSSVAAFLLNRHGFDAFVLDGGLATALPHLSTADFPDPVPEISTEEEKTNAAMNAFLLKSDENPVENKQENKSRFTYAEYWGATVDVENRTVFDDSDDMYKVEKTKAFKTTDTPKPVTEKRKPVTETPKPVIKESFTSENPVKPATKPVSKPAVVTPSTRFTHHSNNLARNFFIGISIITALAGIAVFSFSTNKTTQSPQAPETTVLEQRVPESPNIPDSKTRPTIAPVNKPVNNAANTPSITAAPVEPAREIKPPVMEKEIDAPFIDTPITSSAKPMTSSEEDMLLLLEPAEPAPVITQPPAKKSLDPATRGFIE